jgi:hypothetical protein
MVALKHDGTPSARCLQFDSESTTMKTRKLIYLTLFSVCTALSPTLLSVGKSGLLAHADSCQHCPAQLVAPSISLGQLFL